MQHLGRLPTRDRGKLNGGLGRVEEQRRVVCRNRWYGAERLWHLLGADHLAVEARDICELKHLSNSATRRPRRVVLLAYSMHLVRLGNML